MGGEHPGDEVATFTGGRMALQAGVGLAVGLLGGAVGLILGSIRLPALIRILRVDPRIAAGTNLFIGFVMGSVGWIGHLAQGQVNYPLLAMMAASAMVGSYYGAKLTGRVSLDKLIGVMGRRAAGRGDPVGVAGIPAFGVVGLTFWGRLLPCAARRHPLAVAASAGGRWDRPCFRRQRLFPIWNQAMGCWFHNDD